MVNVSRLLFSLTERVYSRIVPPCEQLVDPITTV